MSINSVVSVSIIEARLSVLVGTKPEERLAPQLILANITYEYDASLAAQTDALAHAVDYESLYKKIDARVSTTSFLLLERLASYIIEVIFEDPKIMRATILLEKPGVFPGVKGVSLSLSVSRDSIFSIQTNRCY